MGAKGSGLARPTAGVCSQQAHVQACLAACPNPAPWQGMIEAQAQGGSPWAAHAQRLLDPGSRLFRWPRPGGHDDKAHPPIHPLKPYPGGDRDKEQLFEFIVRHFLA